MHSARFRHTVTHALPPAAEEDQIMGMPAPKAITTIDELLALPDDGLRHELLDGEHVVTPSPSYLHQHVLGILWAHLRAAIGDREDVEALSSPADIHLGPRTLVQPDVFVVQIDPARRRQIAWRDVPTPLLAVEILSPTTAARDRGQKRRLYLEAGIEEYWIVDIDAQLIERWRPGDTRPEMVDGALHWALSIGVSGTIEVAKVFGRMSG
jgi:Uma2 family endonuclease